MSLIPRGNSVLNAACDVRAEGPGSLVHSSAIHEDLGWLKRGHPDEYVHEATGQEASKKPLSSSAIKYPLPASE